METPKKILVVDDEENLRLLYEEALKREGYEVILASNGKDAVRMAESEHPDLVILDIVMPGMDGIDAMHDILHENHWIPIILNSAYTHYKDNFMSWACNAYVVKKSGDLSDLLRAVKDLAPLK